MCKSSQLMSGNTKIEQPSLFRILLYVWYFASEDTQHWHLLSLKEQLKASFIRQARDQSVDVSLLWWDTANSHYLPLWKGKPISCPHDVSIIICLSFLVVAGQGLPPRSPLLNSPRLLDSMPIMMVHRGLLHIQPHNRKHITLPCTQHTLPQSRWLYIVSIRLSCHGCYGWSNFLSSGT